MALQSKKSPTPWLTAAPAPEDHLRLFCLPYAGGAASIYRHWSRGLPDHVGVYPIQLPGREQRIAEPPVSEMGELAQAISEALIPYMDRPFILFGHSIGGRIAFELARTLRRRWGIVPHHLIVSGCRAPNIPEPAPLHHLPDEAFIEELRRFAGTPAEVFEHKELLELYLPILRADFTVDETYVFTDENPLECPIAAFGGTLDPEAGKDEIEAWAGHTTGRFTFEQIQGDHFFIHTERDRLLHALKNIFIECMEESGRYREACPA